MGKSCKIEGRLKKRTKDGGGMSIEEDRQRNLVREGEKEEKTLNRKTRERARESCH